MRPRTLIAGIVAVAACVAGLVVAGVLAVPQNAVSVDGASISRASLNTDLASIRSDPAFACYLDATVALRSQGTAQLPDPGQGAAYSTQFVDFWVTEQINNLLIEDLANREHLRVSPGALAAGRQDLTASISATIGEAAATLGGGAQCAPNGAAVVSTLPATLLSELVTAQASGDVVLAHAAGYGLGTASLGRYFALHPAQFQTICVSAIQTASQSDASAVRAAIEGGESFAQAAQASSLDKTSAANGGALGCFPATDGAYQTLAQDTAGLAAGEVSQPIQVGSGYILLQPDAYRPARFTEVIPAVRQAVLVAGSTRAGAELAALTKAARVTVDPRYGTWSRTGGAGLVAPKVPSTSDLVNPGS
ncbi:MAG: peptidylprolyl isomerase [Acidimicrobiales bacterium]